MLFAERSHILRHNFIRCFFAPQHSAAILLRLLGNMEALHFHAGAYAAQGAVGIVHQAWHLLRLPIGLYHSSGLKANPNIAAPYRISCSKPSNSGVLKNSPKVISRPSQSFFTRLTETSRRLGSSILYTLDGGMPARLASSLGLMLRSLQIWRKRFATASFTVIPITSRTAYRIVRKCVFAVAYF